MSSGCSFKKGIFLSLKNNGTTLINTRKMSHWYSGCIKARSAGLTMREINLVYD